MAQRFMRAADTFRWNGHGVLALTILDCKRRADLSGSRHGGAIWLKINVEEEIGAFTQVEEAPG